MLLYFLGLQLVASAMLTATGSGSPSATADVSEQGSASG
eukprot:CAMPEP_0170553388 /NCGR_PEP_ID=MMETSP0211-20121228/11204_1 /TAXON_ID=311385 /ORGANISM="Pseudokeronopsis sp., Strain OXSARD2" /LENGTH=38 /DNA_ID= /DNA_START= /DNA_END= /DNA_ORIENTATION=